MNEPVLHIFLARHGKSEANQPWLFLGRFDSSLCQEGIKQVQALAATRCATDGCHI
ncbi:MAG: phosphoglycerate mutase family protein, partial [Bellilinea sp.]